MAAKVPRHEHAYGIVSHTFPGDDHPAILLTCQTYTGCSKTLIEQPKRRRVLDPETGKQPYKTETPDEFRLRVKQARYPHVCCAKAQTPQPTLRPPDAPQRTGAS